MPVTLDATPGGASANSYVDVAGAQAYFDTRLNTAAWDAADATTKAKALMAATARLEQERYVGQRRSYAQPLQWPRYNAPLPEGYGVDLLPYYDAATIPQPVKSACAEYALHLLTQTAAGTDPLAPTGLEQFESIQVPGAVAITPAPYVPGTLPPMVTRWLRGLMVSNPGQTRLERG